MQAQSFTDQTGHKVTFNPDPFRIVSLVPSQTELLHDLGLEDRVIGITRYCVRPARWIHEKVNVGGTKNLNIDAIRQLNPDLVIANNEENEADAINELRTHFPVWTSDVRTIEDAHDMILSIGLITGTHEKAIQMNISIRSAFKTIRRRAGLKTLYMIWRKPWMAAASETFIDSMMDVAGLENAAEPLKRYPQLTTDDIASLQPELVLLSSEPYPFKQKHVEELKSLLPATDFHLVDGEMFSWYGSRLLHAPAYLNTLMF